MRYILFQFTHLWRCDGQAYEMQLLNYGFNSRTCEGATPQRGTTPSLDSVSIHAPVKVRHTCCKMRVLGTGFNSRTCEGATWAWCLSRVSVRFQFTHLWRCDILIPESVGSPKVSIHAPVKVRQSILPAILDHLCFNSRTCEGATCSWRFLILGSLSFNSRTCEGATTPNNKSFPQCGFNSRTCEGAT